ncbi:sigma-70 family RNA polymerase sigma factor [bacterium]|nr:sigma-70 family RNA polymerase sigma factor [bacterium]
MERLGSRLECARFSCGEVAAGAPVPASSDRHPHFLSLLEPNLDGLYALAMRLSRNHVEAEELVQEASTKAFLRFSSFRPGTNFKAWVMKILVNAFLTGRRAAKRSPVPLDEDAQGLGSRDPSPDENPPWPRTAEGFDDEVKRAVEGLPEAFRAPFLLGALGGVAYSEIAEILGVPVGTVMSRIHRARARLRSELKGWAREQGWLGSAARFASRDSRGAAPAAFPRNGHRA